MFFNDRLKALRINNSMTQKELSDKLNVSVMTVRNWELGEKSPSMNAIVSLAQTFHVTSDYMLGIDADNVMDHMLLDTNEKKLLDNYRCLDEHGRRAVYMICKLEKCRVNEDEKRGNIVTFEKDRKPSRYIPKYIAPSAAGFSATLDGDDFEMLLVDDTVPDSADFAVRIQGDSMLPYIHDGETVYVKKTTDLSIGDVGIFCANGAMYCKQYCVDGAGNLILVSANPELKNTNVFVDKDNKDVVCYGKVILSMKTPLPDYIMNK